MRNGVMHTSTMKVTTADLSTYVTSMIDLLQDSRYLLKDLVAQQAVMNVQEVKLAHCCSIALTHQFVLGKVCSVR